MKIARGNSEERIARLTKTAISVATPHYGTPLANHFLSVQGQTMLLVLSALATSGQGRGTILAAAKAIALVARLDDWIGRKETTLDRIAEGLLRKIRFNRRDPAWMYLGEIERDQGAILQLTPEGIDMFNAAVADHPGIDYSCVVAGVPKPREAFKLKEIMDPEYLALRSLAFTLRTRASQLGPSRHIWDIATSCTRFVIRSWRRTASVPYGATNSHQSSAWRRWFQAHYPIERAAQRRSFHASALCRYGLARCARLNSS